MTQTTLTKQQLYIKAKKTFDLRVAEVSDRPTISQDLCDVFVKQLLNDGVSLDSSVAVYDTTPNLALTLHEHGFTNLTLVQNRNAKYKKDKKHTWISTVQGFCHNQGIKTLIYSQDEQMPEFDVIIGNPPFQNGKNGSKTQNAWKKFLKQAAEHSNYVKLILPSAALAPAVFSKYKDLVTHVDLDIKQYFPKVGSTFCSLTLDSKPGSMLVVHTAEKDYELERGSMSFIPPNFNDKTLDDLKRFLTGTRKWEVRYHYDTRKFNHKEDGKYSVRHTSSHPIWKTDDYHPSIELIRVSVDKSGNPHFRVNHNIGLTQSHMWTIFDTIEEAEAYAEWGNSEEVQSFLRSLKWSGWNEDQIIFNLK